MLKLLNLSHGGGVKSHFSNYHKTSCELIKKVLIKFRDGL